MVDYRPTPGQRSTIELLKYLAVMGPVLVQSALAGKFDEAAWGARAATLEKADFPTTVKALAAHADEYEALLAKVPDEAFRKEIEMFGQRNSIGALMVSMVLGGCAAYRTQLFCYMKSCGRSDLGTMNLWAGMDAPAAATT
jgi:hypothetical protein